MREEIVAKLKGLLSSQMNGHMKVEEITESMSLYGDGLGLDSVELIDFISEVEREFKIQFADEELRPDAFRDIGTLSYIVSRKISVGIASGVSDPTARQ